MGEKFKLCLGCMELKNDDGICPNCGYSENTPYLPSYIAPGTVLNERYLIGKLLSYNGEGATYLAYDAVTNKKILVREYMPDTLCKRVKGSSIISVNQNNLVQYKNFMSEFTELNKILAKMRTLNHINPALELFAENNTTYVVFEYIEGITLKEFLQENAGELSWDEVKKLLPPIFTTLSLVHNAGIVHRGISLDTIWYTNKGELKLSGFCITASRTANTELAPEIFAGYAAPEQYSSSNWQGTWTDVYAISAVLYRMLTGCMPSEAISRIGNDNLCEPAAINRNIPSNVSKVIMSGLKLSGDMRIQTVTELVTKLFEQPDYLDQSASSKTATIAIPRQQVRSYNSQLTNKEMRSKKKNSKFDRIRIPFIVFIVVIVILTIATITAVALMNANDSNNTNADLGGSGITEIMISSDNPDETISETEMTQAMNTQDINSEDALKDYTLPNFIGKEYDLIENSASYQDWLFFIPEYEYNEEFPKGQIFNQSIPENEKVAKGTELKVKISKGSKLVAVPEFYGVTENDYITMLNNADIKFSKEYLPDVGFVTGYIIRTSKQPGESIDVSIGEILTVYICDNGNAYTSYNFN